MKISLYYCFTIALLITSPCLAGIISHNDYTAGSVVTAAGQNTNENAIVNEFNGNISAANLANDAVTTGKILDGTILNADLNSTLQSTITYVAGLNNYNPPNLQFVSVTLVDISSNTGVANTTCLLFPSGTRCVTEDTSSTNKYRRFDITATASYISGTEDSGLRSSITKANNTWYSLYGVKSQANTANFVIVGDTITPTGSHAVDLNNLYGVGAWVYLGPIRNGDNNAVPADILAFEQYGPVFQMVNTVASSSTNYGGDARGMLLQRSATSPASASTAIGVLGAGVPDPIKQATIFVGNSVSGNSEILVQNIAATIRFANLSALTGHRNGVEVVIPTSGGIKVFNSAVSGIDIWMVGFYDSVLARNNLHQL